MIYLDSALINDAQIVEKWGWVKGITTNPTLLAKSERSPAETLQQLAAISPGELYYQLCAADFEGMLTEGRQAYEIIGEKTVLKIPATLTGFRAVACLSAEIPCAVTAIYSAAQAAVAQHQSRSSQSAVHSGGNTATGADGRSSTSSPVEQSRKDVGSRGSNTQVGLIFGFSC